MTRAQVAELWALQQFDSEIDRLTAEEDATNRALAADPTQPARARLQAAQRAAAERGRAVRDAETALEDTQTRLKRQEARLYGGGAAPKELGALQQEIAHLQATRAAQEESLLEAMMAAEQAQATTAKLEAALHEAERARERERAELAARLEAVTVRLADVRERRTQHAAACDAPSLARYEAVRKARGGRGVAEVRGGVCQACRVTVTPATLQKARSGAELVPCPNCGRILYVV